MSDYQVETRRRSRSKTPFLRSSCDHETCDHTGDDDHAHHHHHHKKKLVTAPNVQTIVEETTVISSKSGASNHKSSQKSTETITATASSQKKSSPTKATTTPTAIGNSNSTVSTSTTVTRTTRRLIGDTSTPKFNEMQASFSEQFGTEGRRIKESMQNDWNVQQERALKDATNESIKQQSANASLNQVFTSAYGSGTARTNANLSQNGDLSDHVAYMEYKKAGEYWKTTPKTDYTYSSLSPHRRYLAPGVVAMPNMSRRSLENHHDRVNQMIERDPDQAEFIRRRYQSTNYIENRRETEKLLYDSGDEIDTFDKKRFDSYYNQVQKQQQSWYMWIITTITSIFTSTWGAITGQNSSSKNHQSLYYTRYNSKQERGFFGSIGHAVGSMFLSLWRTIYMGISQILLWDTWLLRSSNPENRNKKRFLLLLLLLLPLLLAGAWYLLSHNDREYYLKQTEAILPLSLLASVRTGLYNTGASAKGLLEVPGYIKNLTYHYVTMATSRSSPELHIHNIEANLQKSGLSAEEYENILKHINSYVQQLVEIKMQEQKKQYEQSSRNITPEQTEIIVRILHDNLETIARQKRYTTDEASNSPKAPVSLKLTDLSDADLEKLASLVQIQLEALGWGERSIKLSPENLEEIKRLIMHHIEVNKHEHFTMLVERIDIDALLERLLKAPQLAEFVDRRITLAVDSGLLKTKEEGSGSSAAFLAFERHQDLINNLNQEVKFVRSALGDTHTENEDLQRSILRLKASQEDLLQRLQQHEHSTDERFSNLLAEIDVKLKSLKDDNFALLNKQVKLTLVEILGFKSSDASKLSEIDLQGWVRNTFVAKEYLEERLLTLNEATSNRIKEEIDQSGALLMRDISERLKKDILLAVEKKYHESNIKLQGEIRSALSEQEVRNIVKSVLAVYDADKTGLVDFALESAGGQILSTRCTESYQTKSAQISVFGIPLWYPTNTPRVAISPHVQPGECWAFQGFPGFLVLKLNSMVYVTGFTLEHIPKSLSPNGRIDSAPRNFTVWGLEHEKDQEPILFGEYEYSDNDAALQYFPVQNLSIQRPYDIVELRIETNHGHPQYTCLYRFRVHGKPNRT